MRLDKIIARNRLVDLRSVDLEGALEELLEVSIQKFPDLKRESLLKGLLARESGIQKAVLLVAAEISEIGNRSGEGNVLLSLATAIDEAWLKEIFPDDYRETRGVSYDGSIKRVVSRRERRFRDLVLEAKQSSEEAPLNEAAALLTKEVLAGRLKLDAWDEAVEQWILRVNRLAEWFPELEVNPITDADRATLIRRATFDLTGLPPTPEAQVFRGAPAPAKAPPAVAVSTEEELRRSAARLVTPGPGALRLNKDREQSA